MKSSLGLTLVILVAIATASLMPGRGNAASRRSAARRNCVTSSYHPHRRVCFPTHVTIHVDYQWKGTNETFAASYTLVARLRVTKPPICALCHQALGGYTLASGTGAQWTIGYTDPAGVSSCTASGTSDLKPWSKWAILGAFSPWTKTGVTSLYNSRPHGRASEILFSFAPLDLENSQCSHYPGPYSGDPTQFQPFARGWKAAHIKWKPRETNTTYSIPPNQLAGGYHRAASATLTAVFSYSG